MRASCACASDNLHLLQSLGGTTCTEAMLLCKNQIYLRSTGGEVYVKLRFERPFFELILDYLNDNKKHRG